MYNHGSILRHLPFPFLATQLLLYARPEQIVDWVLPILKSDYSHHDICVVEGICLQPVRQPPAVVHACTHIAWEQTTDRARSCTSQSSVHLIPAHVRSAQREHEQVTGQRRLLSKGRISRTHRVGGTIAWCRLCAAACCCAAGPLVFCLVTGLWDGGEGGRNELWCV